MRVYTMQLQCLCCPVMCVLVLSVCCKAMVCNEKMCSVLQQAAHQLHVSHVEMEEDIVS